jgi:hypothetical protein
MKCMIDWCQEESDPYFESRCPDHFREWLATLSPSEKARALGPELGLPEIVHDLQAAEVSGKFIFLERPNGDVSQMCQGLSAQVPVQGQGKTRSTLGPKKSM